MKTKFAVTEKNVLVLRRGAAVIYEPQTKYVQVLSDIRLLQSHCGVVVVT